MNSVDKKNLKIKAHSLKPVVMIGQSGLTEAVLTEIDLALNAHELIKIKIRAEREERREMTEQLCKQTKAELIQKIGQMIVIYRVNPEK